MSTFEKPAAVGKRGPKPTYNEDELCELMLEAQELNPLYSEGSICAVLKVGRQYIADRASRSEKISLTRKECDAIRERAWLQTGISGMGMGKDFNATVYIWMTRNILGWRDDRPQQGLDDSYSSRVVDLVPAITKEQAEKLLKDRDKS